MNEGVDISVKMREMATAFFSYNDKLLMMKKKPGRVFSFEFWSGVGGHLEAQEINHPYEACLREIEEETGLKKGDLFNLELRYILLRQKDDEIRQQYVYFGESRHTDVISSEEGELYWIHKNDVENLQISTILKFMLQHYNENRHKTSVHVGTMTMRNNEEPQVQWTELMDPKVF
ncbi:NUDIX domain-containing protein [Paenibacillus marinisediminis]